MMKLAICLLGATLILNAGCATNTNHNNTKFQADIQWTSYGIPHVKAADWGSLGYGFAYATATDAVCVIAKDLVTVNGQMTKYFGDTPKHIASDVFHTSVLTAEKIAAFDQAQTPKAQWFAAGYARGYNRYLKDHATSLPASCKGQPWVKAMQEQDVSRLSIGVGIRYGLGWFTEAIANASPNIDDTKKESLTKTLSNDFNWPIGFGSNAIAVGAELTATDRSLLLGNPHYPWHGPSRFHLIHLTIPGELDVMGTSLLNTSRVSIGFNQDIAWTHTISTATRFTIYRLSLNPENRLEYLYDGQYKPIVPREITITKPDGSKLVKTVYDSHFGPIIENKLFAWDDNQAWAIRDAVVDNYLTAQTYDELSKASTVAEVESAISNQGVYWVNTIAADRHGDVFYADISGTPNIDAQLLANCRIVAPNEKILILDGSRSRCEWKQDERSAISGTLPPEDMPRLFTKTYVTNSNDSYWLSNPDNRLEGYSPTIGKERTTRSLRTRAGLSMLNELLANKKAIEQKDLENLLYSHRNYGAELLLDDVLKLCDMQQTNEIAKPCLALRQWDRTMSIDSTGGHVWREFWDTAQKIEDLWSVEFDVNDPINTPKGIRINDARVRSEIRKSLIEAENRLTSANIPLNARLGDIQFAQRNNSKIPIPGGEGWAGTFSMIRANLTPNVGYSPILYGNSYIQSIGWNRDGKVSPRAMLTYSQSPNPNSKHYQDLTERYAQGAWINLPFTEEEIKQDTKRSIKLME